MIIVAPSYALSELGIAEAWKPIIGWQNVVTFSNISADGEESLYPATNLANPATNLVWLSDLTVLQYVTCLMGAEPDLDYIGVARHNWGSTAIPVTVEGLPFGGDPDDDGDWTILVPEQVLPDDAPALFRFTGTPLIGIRFKLDADGTAPRAGVIKAGELIVLQKGVPPGHTPISYGRTVQSSSPKSQGGDHLGKVVLTAGLSTSIVQQALDPAWYRETLEPFRLASATDTFFWAWAPQDYPNEVGYCETTNDPRPVVNFNTGEIDITFEIAGIAL